MLTPLPPQQWNRTTAAHLLNRAGFGGTPAEVDKLTALGLEKAVESFFQPVESVSVAGKPEWAKPDPDVMERRKARRSMTEQERRAAQQMERQKDRHQLGELREWWLARMHASPEPLREKMTLFWHGHFATSYEKVKNPYLLWSQNEAQRKMGLGGWSQMLVAMAQEPAMLLYLDNAKSTKAAPNENFAREVMELFALGEGHYSEDDIKNAARAFTGWSLSRDRQSFMNHPILHDNGGKTFMSITGNLDGTDIIEEIVKQPQASRYITAKVWGFFAQQDPDERLVGHLAQEFNEAGKRFGPFLRAIFSSAEFYQAGVIRSQVKSPVQWLVGTAKLLETPLPPGQVMERTLRTLGQELFAPPNVKGWDGGLAWITTSNLLNRYNFAASFVEARSPELAVQRKKAPNAKTDLSGDPINDFFVWLNTQTPVKAKQPDELDKMLMSDEDEQRANAVMAVETPAMEAATPAMNGKQPRTTIRSRPLAYSVEPELLLGPAHEQTVDVLLEKLQTRFIQGKLRPARQTELREYLANAPKIGKEQMRHAIQIILASPEYQLT